VDPPANSWAVQGNAQTRSNLVSSIYLKHEEQEQHVQHLQQKYTLAEACCTSSESYLTDDADIVLIGYGIVSRILRSGSRLGTRGRTPIGTPSAGVTLAVPKDGAPGTGGKSPVLSRLRAQLGTDDRGCAAVRSRPASRCTSMGGKGA
jgi:hypothetical protein